MKISIVIIIAVAVVLVLILTAGVVLIIRKRRTPVPDVIMPESDLDETVAMKPVNSTRLLISGGGMHSTAGKSLYLVINDIAQPHRRYEIIVEDSIEIGRDPGNPGIAIDYDSKISRKHCTVSQRGGKLWIEDLVSVNKTYVNDEELTASRMLKDNDVISMGNTEFLVRIDAR